MSNLVLAPGSTLNFDIGQLITHHGGRFSISMPCGADVQTQHELVELRQAIDEIHYDRELKPQTMAAVKHELGAVLERLQSVEDTAFSNNGGLDEADLKRILGPVFKAMEKDFADSFNEQGDIINQLQQQLSQTLDMVKTLSDKVETLERPVINYEPQF